MQESKGIETRLAILETQEEERWKSHKTESKIIWATINDKLDLLLKDRDDMVSRKKAWMDEAKNHANTLVGWVLGIPVTIGTIVGLIWGVKRILLLTVLCLFLCGCSITTEFYQGGEKIGYIKQSAKGAAVVETEGFKMQVDSRSPTVWERFIQPVIQGASQTAKENVQVN